MIDIVDPTLHLEKEDTETRTNVTHNQNRIGCPKILECLILIFEIAPQNLNMQRKSSTER